MESNLSLYIERLELMAFFAGYPVIYLLVNFFAGRRGAKSDGLFNTLQDLLPFAYALDGTLYIALMLRNSFPDYSFYNIAAQFENPYLKFWGITSILFWLPLLRRKSYFSLIHSLVFFLLLLKHLALFNSPPGENDFVKNDMKIYTGSLLLNAGTLLTVAIIFFLTMYIRKQNNSSPH